MIFAAMYGKLDCLHSEDALTAAVFTRLRYLPREVLTEWLASAQNYKDPTARMAPSTAEPIIEFWPTVKDTLRGDGSVEPDVIVRFDDEVFIIEAKLWSPKSNTDDGLDQLARQWRGAADHYGAHLRLSALVYLTPHVVPPADALAESAAAMGDAASVLWWLSWSSLAPVLERQVAAADRVARLIASDLLAYLARVGLLRFRGWRLPREWRRRESWSYRRSVRRTYWGEYSMTSAVWRYTR